MSAMWKRRLLSGFCWILSVEFLLGAFTKFQSGPGLFGEDYAVKFTDWGYPSWFRFLVGTGELFAAILLLVPRRAFRFIAAATLVVILTGAVITHIANQDPISEGISAPLHLAISAVLAWVFRPWRWRALLTPWQEPSFNQ